MPSTTQILKGSSALLWKNWSSTKILMQSPITMTLVCMNTVVLSCTAYIRGFLMCRNYIKFVCLSFQHCWRSETQMEDVQLRQNLCGQFAFLQFTHGFLLESHARLRDLDLKLTVSTEECPCKTYDSLKYFSNSKAWRCVFCRLPVLAALETGWGDTDLQYWVQKRRVIPKAHHGEHGLCRSPWLEQRCLQSKQKDKICSLACRSQKH